MQMPERKFDAGGEYRYGFNGQERSTELNVNSYSAEFWQYDARLGRRWNVDPKPTIGISEYSTFSNNPLINCDPYGDTIRIKEYRGYKAEHKKNLEIFKKTLSEQFKGKVNVDVNENAVLSLNLRDDEKLTSNEQKQYDFILSLC